jgi:hypothetical protein
VDREGRTIGVVGAQRCDARFIVHADEKLTAFLELESVISCSLIASCNGVVGCGDASHRDWFS